MPYKQYDTDSIGFRFYKNRNSVRAKIYHSLSNAIRDPNDVWRLNKCHDEIMSIINRYCR